MQAPGFFLFYRTADGKGLPADLFADTASSAGSPLGSPGGRGPVLGTSRGTADFAILVEFDQAATRVPLRHGTNCVVVDAPSDGTPLAAASLDDAGEPVPQYSPATAPGHVAFDISWGPNLSPRAVPNDIPVEQLYHLMQYAVQKTGSYTASVWSLPVGPTRAGAGGSPGSPSAPWLHRQTIPVYNFLRPASPEISPPETSPFAAIGLAVEIGFRLIDLYGDPLPAIHTAEATPLYNDPIITLTEWPGVVAQFEFESSNPSTARLLVEASFDPAAIAPYLGSPDLAGGSPDTGRWRQAWLTAQQRYQQIQQQLADPYLKLAVVCSVSGSASRWAMPNRPWLISPTRS